MVHSQVMKDSEIRVAFHKKRLKKLHKRKDTVVVDELGILHGKYRADIAIINTKLEAYEIKSERDSLGRLKRQINGYNEVFDRISIVAAERHLKRIESLVPDWWGIVMASMGPRGGIHFKSVRRAYPNPRVNDIAIANLVTITAFRRQQSVDTIVFLFPIHSHLPPHSSVLLQPT